MGNLWTLYERVINYVFFNLIAILILTEHKVFNYIPLATIKIWPLSGSKGQFELYTKHLFILRWHVKIRKQINSLLCRLLFRAVLSFCTWFFPLPEIYRVLAMTLLGDWRIINIMIINNEQKILHIIVFNEYYFCV